MSQETEGLLSPLIRDVRLKIVASRIASGSVVLDLACGNGYLKNFLPKNCKYYGVDMFQPENADLFDNFIRLDLLSDESCRSLENWLPVEPDYITCIAFIEHVNKPELFISKYADFLGPKNALIGTTPHPCGRLIHDSLSKIYLCSPHAAEEHESFLGYEEICSIASSANCSVIEYRRFLFGLNQLFVLQQNQIQENM